MGQEDASNLKIGRKGKNYALILHTILTMMNDVFRIQAPPAQILAGLIAEQRARILAGVGSAQAPAAQAPAPTPAAPAVQVPAPKPAAPGRQPKFAFVKAAAKIVRPNVGLVPVL